MEKLNHHQSEKPNAPPLEINAMSVAHHFEAVCRSMDKPKISTQGGKHSAEDGIFDALFVTTDSAHPISTIALDYHVYSYSKLQPHTNQRPHGFPANTSPNS